MRQSLCSHACCRPCLAASHALRPIPLASGATDLDLRQFRWYYSKSWRVRTFLWSGELAQAGKCTLITTERKRSR